MGFFESMIRKQIPTAPVSGGFGVPQDDGGYAPNSIQNQKELSGFRDASYDDDTDAMRQVRGFFDDSQSAGFVDPTNSPAKPNAAFIQEEEVPSATPVMPKPKGEAELMGDIKAPMPEGLSGLPAPRRSGIATGEARDQLLRLAGIETDSARSMRQSGERQSAKQVNVGGATFDNPMEPGIDGLERARRYQEVAKNAPDTEHGRFARKELMNMAKDPVIAQGLRGQVAGERADIAARVKADENAENLRRWNEEMGLKKAEEGRKAEGHVFDLEGKKLENRKKAVDAKVAENFGERKAASDLANTETDNTLKRETFDLKKAEFTHQLSQDQQKDVTNWAKDAAEQFKEIQNKYQARLDKAREAADKDLGKTDIAEEERRIQQAMTAEFARAQNYARFNAKELGIKNPDDLIPRNALRLNTPEGRSIFDKTLGGVDKAAGTIGKLKSTVSLSGL